MFTGIVAGIAIGIGFVLLIVPGLFLMTIWALAAPVVVIERKGVMDALDRSRKLVRGHGWQVFAVIVVLLLINIVLGGVVQAILTSLSDDVLGFALSSLLTSVLIGPLSALAAAVLTSSFSASTVSPATPARPCPPRSAPRCPWHRPVADTPPGQPAPDPAPPPPDPVRADHAGPAAPHALAPGRPHAGPRDRPSDRRRRRGVRRRWRARSGHELVEWVPTNGGPPDLDGLGAAMVFGGAMHVDQEGANPWLRGEKELLRRLLGAGLPLLGVCLGSQLLAEAAGAAPRRASEPEIGWVPVEQTAAGRADPLTGALPERFEAFEWHSYEAPLPDGRRGAGPQPGVPPGLPAGAARARGASSSTPR